MAFDPRCAGEIINIGPDDEFVTINELAEVTAKLIGFKLDSTYTRGRPQEVHLANCSADNGNDSPPKLSAPISSPRAIMGATT